MNASNHGRSSEDADDEMSSLAPLLAGFKVQTDLTGMKHTPQPLRWPSHRRSTAFAGLGQDGRGWMGLNAVPTSYHSELTLAASFRWRPRRSHNLHVLSMLADATHAPSSLNATHGTLWLCPSSRNSIGSSSSGFANPTSACRRLKTLISWSLLLTISRRQALCRARPHVDT